MQPLACYWVERAGEVSRPSFFSRSSVIFYKPLWRDFKSRQRYPNKLECRVQNDAKGKLGPREERRTGTDDAGPVFTQTDEGTLHHRLASYSSSSSSSEYQSSSDAYSDIDSRPL